MPSISYQVLPGFFAQADASTPSSFDFLESSFGILPQSPGPLGAVGPVLTDWQRLVRRVALLNLNAPPGVLYKVIFLARHGQGVHNVAEAKYSTQAWDEHYSKLEGADGLQWFDARLTALGEQQARAAAACWAERARQHSMPVPESFYCSPLIRCLQTARITHAGPEWGAAGAERYRPVVKEGLRETNGVHTCDRRSSKTAISRRFMEATFEPGFTEEDELWTAEHREQWWEQDARLKACMDEIFALDSHVWISITAHSGASRAMMKVLGFPREWRLRPGEIVPMVVRAALVEQQTEGRGGDDG